MKYFYHLISSALCFFVFIGVPSSTYAQCDPTNLYDKIVSSFHNSVAQQPDGTFKIWGQGVANDGVGHVLVPTVVDAGLYPSMTGVPLHVGLGSYVSAGVITQVVVLTSDGLFASGAPGTVLSTSLKSSAAFGPVSVNGEPNGMPPGVDPSDVSMLFVTYQTVAISTYFGFVYVLSQNSDMRGDGGTGSSTAWSLVQNGTSGGVLMDITATRGCAGSLMAVASDGSCYTWGDNTFLGDGSGMAARNLATQMTIPPSFNASNPPKMIGVTGSRGATVNGATLPPNSNYFLLDEAGDLYGMGSDGRYIGTFSGGTRTTWVSVMKTPSTAFTDCRFISPQEHDNSYSSMNVFDAAGTIYSWGCDGSSMLGRGGGITHTVVDPGIPTGFTPVTDVARYIETGGHTTVYVKELSDKYCYVGHKVDGSMGDNTTTNSHGNTSYNCIATGAAQVCGGTSFDSGDVPIEYEGNGSTNICMHIYVNSYMNLFLGSNAPESNNADLNNVAMGADNTGMNGDGLEEDGLPVVPDYVNSGTYTLTVNTYNSMGVDAHLYAWVDWNLDNMFDLGEMVDADVADGQTNVTISWGALPTNLITGQRYYIRLRFTTDILSSAFGTANDGEVEDYYLIVNDPLDVEITQFSAAWAGMSDANLSWTTEREVNLDVFEIERSFDGETFEQIATVNAHGSASSTTNYSYQDKQIVFNTSSPSLYYRLKMTDSDGKFHYSSVIMLRRHLGNTYISPNPSDGHIQINTTLELLSARLYNSAGQLLNTIQDLGQNKELDVSYLPTGIYYLRLETNEGLVESQKIEIIK